MKQIFNLFLIGLLLGIQFNCRSMPKGYHEVNGKVTEIPTSDENCNDLISLVSKKWSVSNEFNCYYFKEKNLHLLKKNSYCFIGWMANDIVNLFGEPNLKDNVMSYNISDNCDSTLGSRKYTLYFYYKNSKVNFSDRLISGMSLEKILIN